MDSRLRMTPGRAARQLKSRPRLLQDDTAGVVILVTPSATGKGIHKRWKYSESSVKMRKTIPAEKRAAIRPVMRELTVHIDGAFTHLVNRSPSASEPLPPVMVNSSTVPVESETGHPIKSEDEDMHITLRENGHDQDIPSHVVLNPDELDTEAVMRRMMEQEQRMEETFQAQWLKMLDQRQAALRSIKGWARRGKVKYSSQHGTRATAANSNLRSTTKGKGSQERKPRGRPLGPCGTVIIDIDDEYKRGERTSPPPVYPPEWVARKLTGRESTESIEEGAA